MNVKTYSSRSTALRGIARLGLTDKAKAEELVKQNIATRNFEVDLDAVDAALGLSTDTSEEDENLILACGHSNCPSCGIHLSNGLMDFDTVADSTGSEKAAFAEQQNEWSCMGCGAQWGKVIVLKGTKARGEPLRHYTNKSTVDGAVALCRSIYAGLPDARRKDAIAAAVEQGVAFYTARTQYQKWFQAQKATRVK